MSRTIGYAIPVIFIAMGCGAKRQNTASKPDNPKKTIDWSTDFREANDGFVFRSTAVRISHLETQIRGERVSFTLTKRQYNRLEPPHDFAVEIDVWFYYPDRNEQRRKPEYVNIFDYDHDGEVDLIIAGGTVVRNRSVNQDTFSEADLLLKRFVGESGLDAVWAIGPPEFGNPFVGWKSPPTN